MPGEISRSSVGPADDTPYVPSWCYEAPGPRICTCGDHEGYHNDVGECLRRAACKCEGFIDQRAQERHQTGCICADCSGAELTADND